MTRNASDFRAQVEKVLKMLGVNNFKVAPVNTGGYTWSMITVRGYGKQDYKQLADKLKEKKLKAEYSDQAGYLYVVEEKKS